MRNKFWQSSSLPLADDHAWSARPGCKVLVLERGAVRFDYPREWTVQPGQGCMQLNDKKPPDDDCRLCVSFLRIPDIDYSGLPVVEMLDQASRLGTHASRVCGEIQETRHGALQLAWRENRFVDPVGKEQACSRICIARKGRIQALITFDFWQKDAERCAEVWDTVLATLQVDIRLNPRTGRIIRGG